MTRATSAPTQATPLTLLAGGTAIFMVCATAALSQLSRSNREHELTFSLWIAPASAFALVLLVLSVVRALRAKRPGRRAEPASWAIALPAVLVAGLDLLLLVGSASAIPAVLAH